MKIAMRWTFAAGALVAIASAFAGGGKAAIPEFSPGQLVVRLRHPMESTEASVMRNLKRRYPAAVARRVFDHPRPLDEIRKRFPQRADRAAPNAGLTPLDTIYVSHPLSPRADNDPPAREK